MTIRDIDLSKISYQLAGVNVDNKLSVWWYDLKKSIGYLIPFQVVIFYDKKIKTIFKPQHSRIRKSIPKYWSDLDYVLLQVNFEIIKSFYEDEYAAGFVNWQSDKSHKAFARWLEQAYNYVKYERPELEVARDKSYPDDALSFKQRENMSYDELYGEVDKLEKQIHDMDTKTLTQLIKHRDFLWT
jgi:hypothetical protein